MGIKLIWKVQMAALLDGALNALPDEVLTVMFGGLFVCGWGEKKITMN